MLVTKWLLPITFYWTVTGYTTFDSFYLLLTTYNMFQILITGNSRELQLEIEKLWSEKSRVTSKEQLVKSYKLKVKSQEWTGMSFLPRVTSKELHLNSAKSD